MKKIVDWSRPRTWMVAGLLVAVLGAVLGASSDDEGTNPLVIVGVVVFVLGAIAFVVLQVAKGLEAGRRD